MVERDQALRDAELWFLRHGLPYFVRSERAIVHRGLSRARDSPRRTTWRSDSTK